MPKAICPGTFDPVTLGHVDIIERAAVLFDDVVVAIGTNVAKSRLFTSDEREQMARAAVAHLTNVEVVQFDGLLTDFARSRQAVAIVKGVRVAGDMEFELQMAQMNAHLTGVQTVLLPSAPAYSFVSSSLIKEVASFGGDVSAFLSPSVHAQLIERLARRQSD